ncbi:phytanoyl-CoA dioxygenase family protein [Sphingomonas sp.]|uniref:phytanoyl-CoA dioxygenase family protein n=2 Tax=unclassified Sphingomonas TaxID=196159 RepID=UPI00257EEBAA|nr:phytanoyl-CoA dioxygenase family protein [Sphingomonas sp.]
MAARSIIDEFNSTGYLIIDLDIPNFAELAEGVISDLAPVYDHNNRIENAWRRSPGARYLAVLPKILNVLEELYGRPAFPFQTLNFNKGTEQAAHSDTIHFDSKPAGFMAGVWVALEDIDAGNGPLRYYPGSQLLPQLTLKDAGIDRIGKNDPYQLYRTAYEPMIARVIEDHNLRPQEAHLKRGQALIWSANILHGGSPIIQEGRSRHSQVTHYYFDGCSYHTPLLSDDERGIYRRYPVDIRTGRNVAGEEDGRPLRVPTAQRLKSWTKTWLRRGTKYQR